MLSQEQLVFSASLSISLSTFKYFLQLEIAVNDSFDVSWNVFELKDAYAILLMNVFFISYSKGDAFTAAEVRDFIKTYVKDNELASQKDKRYCIPYCVHILHSSMR